MKNDITRNTFNALKNYTRVIHQQGRVHLDADWNEQTDILLHYLRALAEDLIGPHGGPVDRLGFEIIPIKTALGAVKPPLNPDEKGRLEELLDKHGPLMGPGRYYVEGWLCENEGFTAFFDQRDYPMDKDSEETKSIKNLLGGVAPVLLYLDVWERNITWIEDDHIREVALAGGDTAARAKVVSQVRALDLTKDENKELINTLSSPPSALQLKNLCKDIDTPWGNWKALRRQNCGLLKAEVKPEAKSDHPCITSPESRYRGTENQLYRVEIHLGGKGWDGKGDPPGDAATFKWSRDNGSVAAAWLDKDDGNNLTVTGVHDCARGFAARQWIELIDEERELRGEPGTLVQLSKVEGDVLTIDPGTASRPIDRASFPKNPKIGRWDQQETDKTKLQKGAITIVEGSDGKGWFTLEDGIQIQFQPAASPGKHSYRAGDYWLIPARVATGDIEWPKEKKSGKWVPGIVPPHGIEHHYAPLALVQRKAAAANPLEVLADLRHEIPVQGQC